MDTLFLLRSFGDFTVALWGYRQAVHPPGNRKIIASAHLQPLYAALCRSGALPAGAPVDFVDIGIRHNLMACFTNRYLFTVAAIRELTAFRHYLKKINTGGIAFLEQSARIKLVELATGKDFGYVHNGSDNVYDAYTAFWSNGRIESPAVKGAIDIRRVLLMPGSRKAGKRLPAALVEQLLADHKAMGHEMVLAGLPAELSGYGIKGVAFRSFDELIHTVADADLVYTADSLPAHIAQLLGRKHIIYYHHRINAPWITPEGEGRVVPKR